jgi:hypothetical protein
MMARFRCENEERGIGPKQGEGGAECAMRRERQSRQQAQRFPNRNHLHQKTILSVIAQTFETDQILPNRMEIGGFQI